MKYKRKKGKKLNLPMKQKTRPHIRIQPDGTVKLNRPSADISLESLKSIYKDIEDGLPLEVALKKLQITPHVFKQYAETNYTDYEAGKTTQCVMDEVGNRQALFIAKHVANINEKSDKAWQASCWLLERNFPALFSQNRTNATTPQGQKLHIEITSNVPRPTDIIRTRLRTKGEKHDKDIVQSPDGNPIDIELEET